MPLWQSMQVRSPGQQIACVDRGGARGLLGQVHRLRGMAVAALQRVVRLQPRPFVLGKLQALIEEFLARVDRAEDLAPDLLRGLHLARDLVGPIVRHMAVGADRAHAGAVGEMHGARQLLIHVAAHLVAGDAERLGVGGFHRGVEAAPEHHAAREAAQREKAQAEVPARRRSTMSQKPQSRSTAASRAYRLAARWAPARPGTCSARAAGIGLRHVAGGAEIAARRHVGEHLAVAVHEVRDADHRRAGALDELARVAGQAAVGVERDLIAVDRMRDDRRLFRIVAHRAARRR